MRIKKETLCLICNIKLNKENRIYCGASCQQEHKYIEYINRWKNGVEIGYIKDGRLSAYLRKYLFIKYDNKCCKCGWAKINDYTGLIPLQANHIDGNWRNNKENNLELLCPNCHSLTDNYCSLNKGKGRPRK